MLWSRTDFDWELVIVAVLLAVIGADAFDIAPPVDLPYLNGVRLLLAVGLGALALRRWQLRDFAPVWTPLDVPVALLLVAALVSTAAGPFQNTAAGGVRQLLQSLVVFYLVVNALLRPESLKILLTAVILAGVALALWGAAQVLLGVDSAPYVDFAGNTTLIQGREVRRAVASFPSSNVLGGYLAVVLPLALAWLAQPGLSRLERAAAALAAAVLLLGILLTFARGAWLTAVLVLVGAAWLLAPRGRARWLVPAAVLVLALLALAPFYSRLLDLFSTGERVTIWGNTLRILADERFLGVGLRNFPDVYLERYGDPRFNAHNLYLQIAVELGLLGLLAFLSAAALWLLRVVRTGRAAADPGDRLLLLGLAGSVAALLVHGTVEAVWAWEPFAELVWLLLGLGLVASLWAAPRDASGGEAAPDRERRPEVERAAGPSG